MQPKAPENPSAIPHHVRCIRAELERRKLRNPYYSLRAYARQLGLDPSSLSRFMAGKQPMSPSACVSVIRKLSLGPDSARSFVESYADEKRRRTIRGLERALGIAFERPAGVAEVVSLAAKRCGSPEPRNLWRELDEPLNSILSTISYVESWLEQGERIDARSWRQALGDLRVSAERIRGLLTAVAVSSHAPEAAPAGALPEPQVGATSFRIA